MSMSTFVALCLLALPPSDCPGGCHLQHHLPLLGRHVLPSLDGEFDGSGDYGDLMAGDGFVVSELPEPAAPLVLLGATDVAVPPTFLASSDRPPYWTAVPFGPLSVEVRIPTSEIDSARAEYVVLLLDGNPVEMNRDPAAMRPAAIPATDGVPYELRHFSLPCPAPGKHIVQARYKEGSRWSRLSNPLYFDVRLPSPPRIVGISNSAEAPVPIEKAGLISVTSPSVRLHLANLTPNASVAVYLDGRFVESAAAEECCWRRFIQTISGEKATATCCHAFTLEGSIEPGIHTLTVRTVHSLDSCQIVGEPSNEVVFRYYDEDVYLLRPGRYCNNRCSPSACDPALFLCPPYANALGALAGTETLPLPPASPSSPPAAEQSEAKSPAGNQPEERPKPEEAKAAPQSRAGQAECHCERAIVVTGPPSPFYFASTAYFPIRQFGVQGEALDRDGAVIYEDMVFSFDREGNYNVRFTIGTPAMPTTIQLRFLIQTCPGGPWHTVTLEPIGFPPTKVADGKYTPSLFRNHVVRGNSEILRRCYGEMGQNATIRREGTARFGFGLAGLSQSPTH